MGILGFMNPGSIMLLKRKIQAWHRDQAPSEQLLPPQDGGGASRGEAEDHRHAVGQGGMVVWGDDHSIIFICDS